MKPTTKAALVGAILAIAVVGTISQLVPTRAQAAPLGGEQYKVVDLSDYRNPQQAEQVLNQLGADGWKVRAGMMGAVILAK